MTIATALTAAALTAAASLALTATPAGATTIGDPGLGAPTVGACNGAARTAVAQAYAKAKAKANGASLTITETQSEAGRSLGTTVTNLDTATSTLRVRWHYGPATLAGIDATQTGTGAGPYTLTQRIGGGNTFTFSPYQSVRQANAQAAALAKLLKQDNLGAISYTIPTNVAMVANGAALLADPLDKTNVRFADLCLSAAKQANGTTLYTTITGLGRTFLTDATGVLIRASVDTGYVGTPGRYTLAINWATPVIPVVPAESVRALDASVDDAANIVLLRDVAAELASGVRSAAQVAAAEQGRPVSVAHLRAAGARYAGNAGGRYRLGDVFSQTSPARGPIQMHMFGTADYLHPFTVTPIPGGVKVEVAAGGSRAGYALTVGRTGITTTPLVFAQR